MSLDHIYIIVVVRRARTAKPPVINGTQRCTGSASGLLENDVVYGGAGSIRTSGLAIPMRSERMPASGLEWQAVGGVHALRDQAALAGTGLPRFSLDNSTLCVPISAISSPVVISN